MPYTQSLSTGLALHINTVNFLSIGVKKTVLLHLMTLKYYSSIVLSLNTDLGR